MRAAHQLLDAEPKIFRDPLAVGLTHDTSAAEIRRRATELLTPASKLLRSAIVLRSRYAEDALAAAMARGMEQYVLVGAGLDTFALRQPVRASRLRIFEVDHPATQRWKLERFLAAGARPPANIAHVPVDLESNGLEEALHAAGFDRRKPAFFSWLGVMQYLDERAVRSTLSCIAGLAPRSGVVFSFNPPDSELDDLDLEEARAAARRAGALGEPWRTRPTVEPLLDQLRALGFGRVEHLYPRRAQVLYFNGRKDGLRAARFEQLISAFV